MLAQKIKISEKTGRKSHCVYPRKGKKQSWMVCPQQWKKREEVKW